MTRGRRIAEKYIHIFSNGARAATERSRERSRARETRWMYLFVLGSTSARGTTRRTVSTDSSVGRARRSSRSLARGRGGAATLLRSLLCVGKLKRRDEMSMEDDLELHLAEFIDEEGAFDEWCVDDAEERDATREIDGTAANARNGEREETASADD